MSEILARKFAEIDAANPDVWQLFCAFTHELIARGFRHYSADAVLHRIRWQTDTPLDDGSGFRVNNVWSAWYSRKFHREYPQHAGFFRTRVSKADRVC